jgi:hypothetical protein
MACVRASSTTAVRMLSAVSRTPAEDPAEVGDEDEGDVGGPH